MKTKPLKLVKTKSGYHGNGDEYQLAERTFLIHRTAYSNMVFEKPKINAGQEIFRKPRGDYQPFIKKFREFLKQKESTT